MRIAKIIMSDNETSEKQNNNDCCDICCEICMCLFVTSVTSFFLLCFIGSILFPILGSNSECGFRYESTVKMTESNGTIINSTIYNSEKYEDNINYRCYNYIVLEPVFICKIHTYSGSNLTSCNESLMKNGTKLNVFTTKKSDSCHINNLSRNCKKSNIYYNLGVMGIVVTGIIVVTAIFFIVCFLLAVLGGRN
jgi:hypothetical protein